MTDTSETSDTSTDPVVDPREDDPPVTVALLHPDASRRSLLGRKLARSEGVELLLAASLATEAIDEVVDLLPDVVAIFPADDLVPVVERLTDEVPTVSVLVLDPEPEHFPALVAGARGTLPSGGSEITKAVAGIARDETVLTPEWAVLLLEAIDGVDERVRRLALLSETEREVLDRIGQGDSPRRSPTTTRSASGSPTCTSATRWASTTGRRRPFACSTPSRPSATRDAPRDPPDRTRTVGCSVPCRAPTAAGTDQDPALGATPDGQSAGRIVAGSQKARMVWMRGPSSPSLNCITSTMSTTSSVPPIVGRACMPNATSPAAMHTGPVSTNRRVSAIDML